MRALKEDWGLGFQAQGGTCQAGMRTACWPNPVRKGLAEERPENRSILPRCKGSNGFARPISISPLLGDSSSISPWGTTLYHAHPCDSGGPHSSSCHLRLHTRCRTHRHMGRGCGAGISWLCWPRVPVGQAPFCYTCTKGSTYHLSKTQIHAIPGHSNQNDDQWKHRPANTTSMPTHVKKT